ncbi:hypothetical protein B0H11DRAFT_2237041 [Mycena galericulata]|nr:hypothetical protein B0H11DRAFT_2237041 [Mycena galericulata]
MTSTLPIELIREIIAHVLLAPPYASSSPPLLAKPAWSLISALSLASRTYRALALEAWFRVLHTRAPADLLFLRTDLREVQRSWTRELHCVPVAGWLPHSFDLAGFRRLHTLRLDFSLVESNLFPFRNIPPGIVELDLLNMSWPSPYAVLAIADAFPGLTTLRLSLRRVWCGLCHTCSRVKFVEPVPPKVVYTAGLGLPIHYSRALSPMEHLRTVSITLPYSVGTNVKLKPKDPEDDLWSGECDRCVGVMYNDTEFRERWTARKKGIVVRNWEGKDEYVYMKPPALETVEWIFWKSQTEEDSEVEEEDEDNTDEE